MFWNPFLGFIIIGISGAIWFLSPNQLEEWFENCCFGVDNKEKEYKNLAEEIQALTSAIEEVI